MTGAAADKAAHERGLAMFIDARRRDRFIRSLSDKRLREKLGRRLAHHASDFDGRYVVPIEQHSMADDFDREVYRTLTARGAPSTCYIVAPRHALDGAEVDLAEALNELISYGPALISCIPGQLGMYVGEAANPVLLLQRRADAG